jgi:DNA polymerase-3 subunit alpha
MAFRHLHVHSHYSLLNALPQIKDLVKAAKADNQTALALTDNGNLYGAIEFYQACEKAGIKPIIGMDNYVACRTRHDKEGRIDNRRSRLITLAKTYDGWKNLIKLTTDAHMEGFYYKPRIDREIIEKYKDGVICIMPFFSGEASQKLKNGDKDGAREILEWYKSVFGDDFYYEVCTHPEIEGATDLRKKVITLAREAKVKIVAAQDVYYNKPDDRVARKTLMSIQSSFGYGDIPDTDATEDFSFKTQAEMEQMFEDLPEALENSVAIADECNVVIELAKWKFPAYPIESGRTADDELEYLAYKGLDWRGLEKTDELMKRLRFEIDVIKMKGYAVYFLVVGDLLREARERGILTTIRGSVAGSLTTYVLGITNVNPLEYRLPFERFLNPERPSAPDVDMDYADNRRDEMIDYARTKYGANHVAQIGTFGTMMARGSVRDAARALGYQPDIGDRISKLIPMGAQGFPMTIERALAEVPDLKALYDSDEDVSEIVNMAKKIEGCARHIGVHAAGVLISPDPLVEHVPLQFDPKGEGKIITQFDMHGAGEDGIGLLKFDFLGIRNLAILADAVKLARRVKGVDLDIEKIPLDDPKTFAMLGRGETVGLFQLNGSGMTKWLMQLRPTTIHDINAMVALYRPGPMEMIPEYIKRKQDPSQIVYIDPRLKDILERSYGVITYQDDVMMTAINLAGYSWLEADKLRKAMGKKIPELMEEQKKKLHDGLIEHGLSEEKAEELWKQIEPFAAYGFNKAHAASYGRVAYQTAYMKANFPSIYMAAVLSAESGDTEKVAEIVAECKRMGIQVLPPDVNASFERFTVVDRVLEDGTVAEDIRFGLATIKNFGEGIAISIIEERKKGGPFKSVEDFLSRIGDKNLNRKSVEALVKAGAFDSLYDRATLIANTETMVEYHKETVKRPTNQDSLFGGLAGADELPKIRYAPPSPEVNRKIQLAWEKELLGIFVSGHPLDQYKHAFEKRDVDAAKIRAEYHDGQTAVLGGIVEAVRVIRTKKNDEMAFVKIADFSGSIECVAFPKAYAANKELFQVDQLIAVKGKASKREGETSVMIDFAKRIGV